MSSVQREQPGGQKYWGCLAGPQTLQVGLPCVFSLRLVTGLGGFLELSGFHVSWTSLVLGSSWRAI